MAEKTVIEILDEYIDEINAEIETAEEMIAFYQNEVARNRGRLQNVTRARASYFETEGGNDQGENDEEERQEGKADRQAPEA